MNTEGTRSDRDQDEPDNQPRGRLEREPERGMPRDPLRQGDGDRGGAHQSDQDHEAETGCGQKQCPLTEPGGPVHGDQARCVVRLEDHWLPFPSRGAVSVLLDRRHCAADLDAARSSGEQGDMRPLNMGSPHETSMKLRRRLGESLMSPLSDTHENRMRVVAASSPAGLAEAHRIPPSDPRPPHLRYEPRRASAELAGGRLAAGEPGVGGQRHPLAARAGAT